MVFLNMKMNLDRFLENSCHAKQEVGRFSSSSWGKEKDSKMHNK